MNTNTNETETLQAVMVEAVRGAQASLAEAVEFAMAQVPDVCAQIVRFYTAQSAIFLIVCSVVLFFCPRLFRRCYAEAVQGETAEREMSAVFGCGGVGAAGIVAGVCWVINLQRLLKCALAPKLFLIEYCADFFK